MPKKKVAICQLLIEGGEPQRNINRAEIYIKKASENNCDLIILPECSDLGWTHPSALDEAETIPGKWSDMYCDFSKKFKISICVGLTEKSENCIYNLQLYRMWKDNKSTQKINILKEAKKFYSCGKKIEVFNCKLGNCAISICSDNTKIINYSIRNASRYYYFAFFLTIENDNIEESPYEQRAETMEKVTNDYQNIFISATSVGYIVGGPFEGKMLDVPWHFKMEKKLVMKNNEISTE